MKYVSGLDDIIKHKERFKEVLPNLESVIKLIESTKQQNSKKYYTLERKFVSLCFAIEMIDGDYERIMDITTKQYCEDRINISEFELQKQIYDYLCHIDSLLDYLEKFIKDLKEDNIEYQRKFHDFDRVINELRNEVIHEGIPAIHVIYSDDSYKNSFICYQYAGTLEVEKGKSFYIELEINDKKYGLQELLDITYRPLIKNLKEIIGLIE